MLLHLACTVSMERSADSIMAILLYMTLFFLFCFRILSLTSAILIMKFLDMGLFGLILFGIICDSCTWISLYFFKFGTFLVIISSNTFLIPFCLFSVFLESEYVGKFNVILEIS